MTEQPLTPRDETIPALPESTPPIMALLHAAVDKAVPVETLERLMALHERIADRDAAMEFAQAFAAFQRECPSIVKEAKADRYKYATLDQIARVVNPILSSHGLSYTWDTETTETEIRILCSLRHVNGHTVQSHAAMTIEQGRGINRNQSTGSAMTYGQRYSLIQVLGLTTCQSDDDGASSGSRPPREPAKTTPATTQQKAKIHAMCKDLGIDDKMRKARMTQLFGVDSTTKLTKRQASEMIERLADAQAQRSPKGADDPDLTEIPE